MSSAGERIKIILVADGETDYAFMLRAISEDADISDFDIELIRPEDVGLRRRTGGGHKTLLKDAGLAVIKAAQGFAQGVMVLVDNDGDARFKFPHDKRCNDCRECEAWETVNKIDWGMPVKRGVSIVYQAIETLLLSGKSAFNPQLEDALYGNRLKQALYGSEPGSLEERYTAFNSELRNLDLNSIKARCYPRIKHCLRGVCAEQI